MCPLTGLTHGKIHYFAAFFQPQTIEHTGKKSKILVIRTERHELTKIFRSKLVVKFHPQKQNIPYNPSQFQTIT